MKQIFSLSPRFIFLSAAYTLILRYRRSVLGVAWLFFEPFLWLVVLSTVFAFINGKSFKDYGLYLFCGLLPWRFIESTVIGGVETIVVGEWLLRCRRVDARVFPLIRSVVSMFEFITAFTALGILFLLLGINVTTHVFILPFAIVLVWFTGWGAGLFVSTVYVFFRDIKPLMQLLSLLFFFSAPILFIPSRVPLSEAHRLLIKFHPLTYIVRLFQLPIFFHQWPSNMDWLIASIIALTSVVFGVTSYSFAKKRIYFHL